MIDVIFIAPLLTPAIYIDMNR